MTESIAILDKIKETYREVGLTGYILGSLAVCSLQLGDYESAYAYSQQSLANLEKLNRDSGRGYPLTLQGFILISMERWEQAENVLRDALDIFRQYLPRSQVHPLAGLASVAFHKGDNARAISYIEAYLILIKNQTGDSGGMEYFRNQLICIDVLRVNNDPRATVLLETTYSRLQEQAAKIDDPEIRRSFLENVPEHRSVVKAWEQALQEGSGG